MGGKLGKGSFAKVGHVRSHFGKTVLGFRGYDNQTGVVVVVIVADVSAHQCSRLLVELPRLRFLPQFHLDPVPFLVRLVYRDVPQAVRRGSGGFTRPVFASVALKSSSELWAAPTS